MTSHVLTYEEALTGVVLADERYVVMTAENRAAIRNLPLLLGERFVDVGIAEQALVGTAAGLALRGRTPIVHALAAFLTMRALDFVRTDVGFANLPVKLVGSVPGFLSEANGPTHQALEDVALMRGIPNMHVFCPADEQDLAIGLPTVLASPQPTYVRHNPMQAVVEHSRTFEIGRAEVLADGCDVTILTYGTLFRQAYGARNLLHAEGIPTRLLNLRWLKPVDEAEILRAARETRLLVTLEDHFVAGGLYTLLGEILLRRQMTAFVLPLALEGRWFRPVLLDDVLEVEGFTATRIAERIKQKLAEIARQVPMFW